MRIALWIGGILLLAGLALFAQTEIHFRGIAWTAVSVPLPLSQTTLTSPQFLTTPGEPYDVEIDIDKPVADQGKLGCLIGADLQPEKDCPAIASAIDASWKIIQDGHAVASGDSNSADGGNNVMRLLGEFRPTSKRPYVLEFTTRKDAAALAPYQPKIDVVIDLFERDGLAMGQAFGEIEALGVSGLGAITLLMCLILWGIRTRRAAKMKI